MEEKEVAGPASNITGYFKKHVRPDALKHRPEDSFARVAEDNEDFGTDEVRATEDAKPFEKGGFDWVIPNKFRVVGDPDDGKKFTEVTQSIRMVDNTGKMSVDKAGAHVERTP